MNFIKFKEAVAKQFNTMKGETLFRTQVTNEELWDNYLSSFPSGSNPIYRERTEHDCSCCKQFIRTIGNIVAIIDGKMVSIWDINLPSEPNYQIVANSMSILVKSKTIDNLFLHYERQAGTDKSYEEIMGNVKTWDHFFVNIPSNFVVAKSDIGTILGESRALHDVLCRSLTELTNDSIATVLELIAQNSLYRGEEQKFIVSEFNKLKHEFDALPESNRDNFTWLKSKKIHASVVKIRNSAIGTLLIDLSEGVDLELAVKSFETKVAPSNYKRPTALVTKAMVESAKKTIENLGLTSALERRYATINDININDILFADRTTKQSINGSVFDEIAVKAPKKNMDKVEEISIDKFISDILPTANSIEVMIENNHSQNLVSLIAPTDPTAGSLFKWNNNFSWSYNGDMADSIKERVKKAGGNVTGDLCCRLAWFNTDDLDFHMKEPGKYEIYYGNRSKTSPNGGRLDVDMNVRGETREPVENIFYESRSCMREGTYELQVHNFTKRETTDVGFEVEVDIMGTVHRFTYECPVRHNETITVAKINYSKQLGFTIESTLPSTQSSKEVWGIQTNVFQKVNVMMMSPNYWGGSIGNKHYFFMIDGCINDGQARGFFNEFLKEDLNIHRKVFEIIGSKMKTQESKDQLSGLGFSSTQRNSILCRVTGSFTRIIKIKF